ncbi:MAG: hypothetical protein QXF49_05095 [Thermosphaera sp.]
MPVRLDLPSTQGQFKGRWGEYERFAYCLSVVLGEINVSIGLGVWRVRAQMTRDVN